MFKCEQCGKISKPKEKQFKKAIETREKTYTYEDRKRKQKNKYRI